MPRPRVGGASGNFLAPSFPRSLGAWVCVLDHSFHFSLLCGLQMNGTRPGTGSSRLSPWDKSSHSAHRVDLSAV